MALHPNPLSRVFLTGVIQSRPDHEAWKAQYIGERLLPTRQVGGYKLAWDVVQSENNLAGIYAINGEPIPGSEMAFQERFQEVKNIMASRVLDPQDVMYLREPGQPAVGTAMWNLKAESQMKLRNKIAACDDEVDAQVEYMRLWAMQGQIVWPPLTDAAGAIATPMPSWGDVQVTITFPLRATFMQAATTLTGFNSRAGARVAWTDEANSDPIKDLEVIAELISETLGIPAHGSTLIMGTTLLSRLCFNEKILSWVKGTERGVNMLSVPELKNFIKTQIGYTIEEYAAKWTYRTNVTGASGPTINSVNFLKPNRILIIPPGLTAGYFANAPSPEDYTAGKYVWQKRDEEPPWQTRVGCGLVGFPVLERADQIFRFDAAS